MITQTLAEFLATNNQGDYTVAIGYILEIRHSLLMGEFLALISHEESSKEEEGIPVVVFGRELLEKIWGLLEPRDSKITTLLCVVDSRSHQAFSLHETCDEAMGREGFPFLSPEEFERRTQNGANPFAWKLGISGARVPPERFAEIRKQELARVLPEAYVDDSGV